MDSPSLIDQAMSIAMPGVMMIVMITMFFLTCILQPKDVITFNIPKLQSSAFARMWSLLGPMCANDFPSPDLDDALAQCHGRILDVGPGAGYQLKRFTAAAANKKGGGGGIEMIYGVEPGVEMHDTLRSEANKAGLQGKYRVLNCGVQMEQLIPALEKEGLLKKNGAEAIFDEIVCLRVLCGIPSHEASIKGLYRLLKPGGRMVVFEHVVNKGEYSPAGKWAQHFYMMLGWPFWAGGCQLTRDTLGVLKKAAQADGGWAKIDVRPRHPWAAVPEIYGTLVKKS